MFSKFLSKPYSNGLENGKSRCDRASQSIKHMDLIYQYVNEECVDACKGGWLMCAVEVLKNNSGEFAEFLVSMRELPARGRENSVTL